MMKSVKHCILKNCTLLFPYIFFRDTRSDQVELKMKIARLIKFKGHSHPVVDLGCISDNLESFDKTGKSLILQGGLLSTQND